MKLYNTLTRSVEEFRPIDKRNVRVYTCGPTVYDRAHIGNLAAYIFADTLHRTLVASGSTVTRAMNYTDVDDKTVGRSQTTYPELEPRQALEKLTTEYTALFLEDMKKIGNDIREVTFVRATDHIEAMKQLITKLHASGFAYISDDGVYFSIDAYKKSGKTYGQLLKIDSQNTSRERIQNDEYDKESVHDFALWKIQKKGEPAWEFNLGGKDLKGRPGWHIECSSMSRQILGQPFDIHTGGVDNIFPHHENEIAQSTAGKSDPTMARVFIHSEHVLVDGNKMAKSAGNFYTLDDIVGKGYDPLAFRVLVLQSHYRSQAAFSWANLDSAQARLKDYQIFADLRFQPNKSNSYERNDYKEHARLMLGQLQNDLATPAALSSLSGLVVQQTTQLPEGEMAEFKAFLHTVDVLLGLNLLGSRDISDEQKTLLAEREGARAQKNWRVSDTLRDKLTQQGIGVRDNNSEQIWYRL